MRPTSELHAECVIVGGGLAGAATAYQLGALGMREVVLIEQESVPGIHSSGRNAGMVRQVVADLEIGKLAREGARSIAEARQRWDAPELFLETGSLLLASSRESPTVLRSIEVSRACGVGAEWIDRRAAVGKVEILDGGDLVGAIHTPSDGVVDTDALLRCYLEGARAAGAKVVLSEPCCGVEQDADGRVQRVRTRSLSIVTRRVVNAAGAWASDVGRLAEAQEIPLQPTSRHLFHTGPYPSARPEWPFSWHLDHDVYFRPESGGLLLSPCDQVPARPGVPGTDPDAVFLLATKLEAAFPSLADIPLARSWAGLRTFAADHTFVIGPDRRRSGFFWLAGLGGHGVTVSAAVGKLAARLVLDPALDEGNPFSPSRFAP